MPTSQLSEARLLRFARSLQSARTHDELLDVVVTEVRESVGYNTAWIAVLIPENGTFKVLTLQGGEVESIWDNADEIPIDGDPYIKRLAESGETQIVEDAQIDPNVNREIVEQLGNRTIINIPMMLIDSTFGAIGLGTFGDEGVRLPTESELEYLEKVANQTVVASARILLNLKREEALRQSAEIDRILSRRQRLESMGEMAAGIAHDFTNQLTVITAAATELRDKVQSDEDRRSVELIAQSTERAADLAHQLLAFGKQQDLAFEPIDPAQRVRAIAEFLRPVLGSSIEIELEVAGEMPMVLADARQIDQVLTNLGLNARDAMEGGGKLSIVVRRDRINDDYVAAHPWAKVGEYVLVEFHDTGNGMSQETVERIFEPFFTTKSDTGGTGLGLAVSRGIVEQHGGLIHAESDFGVGSVFSVHLPAIR